MVCRGGPWPSRRTLPHREPGGYGIRPYRGLWRRGVCGFPSGRHVGPARRAGVHARRTVEIQNRERSRRRRVPGTISGLRAGPVARLASETRLRAQCKHRPLQRSDITAGPRLARLAAGPSWFVGEGFIPPAGVPAAAGCGGMRASRPTAARERVPFPFGRALAMVCRGGPWPSRGTLRRHRPRGTISGLRAGPVARLASETRLRAQCKHRPLQRSDITAGPRLARLAAGPSWFVGEGFIPPAGVPAAAGCGGMRASRPTAARGRVPFPFGRALAMVCRGGIYPSRGTLRRREPGGYGIRPYRGL